MLEERSIEAIYSKSFFGGLPSGGKLPGDDAVLMYLRRYLPSDRTVRILDAGCGDGRYASQLAEDGYGNIDAVDLFENIETHGMYRYRRANISELPFEDSTFDFVYCNSVIFYLPDVEEGIREFNRILRPGGRVLITAHTRYSLFTLWRVIKRAIRPQCLQHLDGVRFYSAANYRRWLDRHDFDVICVDGYRLSMILGPLYRKTAKACKRYLRISLPFVKNSMTRTRFMAWVKSECGYHLIVVGRKKLPTSGRDALTRRW